MSAGFVVLLLGRELFLEFGRNVHGFEEAESLVGMLRDSETHTETEFSVVFEEAVGPCRTAAFLVLCPRCGREVTAVNGGATRSVGMLYLGVPRLGGPRRVGLYFRGGRHRFACHPPPKTKPRYAGLVPKGSLSLTQMQGKTALLTLHFTLFIFRV